MANNLADIEIKCKNVSAELQGIVAWKWDDRFKVPLSEFMKDNADKVQPVLAKHLGNCWEINTIKQAPKITRRLADALYGMKEFQLLYTTSAEEEVMLFAAWWPWGDGKTISLRIGAIPTVGISIPNIDTQIQGWFGIKK